VATGLGPVAGTVVDGVADFRGVCYASGTRFGESADPVQAQMTPAAFPQRPGMLNALLGVALGELGQSEDAFTVRIQAPLGVTGAPVIVFIPGGAFTSGSGEARWFSSADWVCNGQVVLVSVNYRLGALGTISPDGDPSGSARAFRDLKRAVRWVHSNIRLFGGDPDNVTLSGDSAGAWYAYGLASTPDLAGLIARALLISLPRLDPLSREDDAARRTGFLEGLGDEASRVDLSDTAVERILDAQVSAAASYRGNGMAFTPAACDDLPPWLTDYDLSGPALGLNNLLVLTSTDEAAAFLQGAPRERFTSAYVDDFTAQHFTKPSDVAAYLTIRRGVTSPYRRVVDLSTLHQFRLPALQIARAAAASGTTVKVVRFGVRSLVPELGSPHCMVLPFLFGGRSAWHDAPMLAGLDPALFDRAQADLREVVLAFVRDWPGDRLVGGPLYPSTLDIDEIGVRVTPPDDQELALIDVVR